MRVIILSLILLCVANSHPYHKQLLKYMSTQTHKEQFKLWHYVFDKDYSINSPESLKKYSVFKQTIAYIKKRNAEQSDFTLGLGPFADLTYEEFKNQYLNTNIKEEMDSFLEPNVRDPNIKSFDELADEVDRMEGKRNLEAQELPKGF